MVRTSGVGGPASLVLGRKEVLVAILSTIAYSNINFIIYTNEK